MNLTRRSSKRCYSEREGLYNPVVKEARKHSKGDKILPTLIKLFIDPYFPQVCLFIIVTKLQCLKHEFRAFWRICIYISACEIGYVIFLLPEAVIIP